ncbi:hypothetical protein E1263_40250 [Kribbella antibiotica]|uniref:Uncharacterized protein n=1 Tax=Kribbella antibiotica TaxID=190195 RepID=A0A4V2YKY1_9ACTN|nr:hypothetical protein [Kribbella antibiotica]TDD44657.1 hypothetical protein E1263_40250 [Kribbella antibiotica]
MTHLTDLDFFAGLAITGTVLGVDATSDLATVQEVLGDEDFYEQLPEEGSNWEYANTDYGLVDFGWGRERGTDEWICSYAGTQNHRLSRGSRRTARRTAGLLLRTRYGQFRQYLNIEDLRAVVEDHGFSLDSTPQWPGADFSQYWVPGVSTTMNVAMSDPSWGPPGTVAKMLGAPVSERHLNHKARVAFDGQKKQFNAYGKELLKLTDRQRAEWLDEHQPTAGPDRNLWWSFLRSHFLYADNEHPPWTELAYTLDRDAAVRGIDTPDRAALALIRWAGTAELPERPTLDDAIALWLTTTPHARGGPTAGRGDHADPG